MVANDIQQLSCCRMQGSGEEYLASALSDADDTVPLAAQQAVDVCQHAMVAVQVEGDLGDEAHVHHP